MNFEYFVDEYLFVLPHTFQKCTYALNQHEHGKHSFLRELREVAPEMELFPENHSPYEKDFVTKSNPYAKFSARHFTKKNVS